MSARVLFKLSTIKYTRRMSENKNMDKAFTRTFGHGGIKLTAYPSSRRVSVEVSAVDAVMDWRELEDFVSELKSTL